MKWLLGLGFAGVSYLVWRWLTHDNSEVATQGDGVDNVEVKAPTFASFLAPPADLDVKLWGSATAAKNDIDNTPPPDVFDNLRKLQVAMRWLTDLYPVRFTSFYRCDALNKLVGGVSNSRHKEGRAMDVVPLDHDVIALADFCSSARYDDGAPVFSYVLRESTWVHCEVDAA